MSRAKASPSKTILNSVRRFQSNDSVRAAEGAFLLVSLGGFYLIAFIRLVDPYSEGLTYELLNTIPIAVQMALTAIVPFVIVVLEWAAALSLLRQQPDSASWATERRLRFLLETTSLDRTTASLVYMPLLPVTLFWTVVGILYQKPYWIVPAVIGLIDIAIIIAFNRYIDA